MPLWGKKEKGGSQTANEAAMSAPNGAAKGGGVPPQEARPRPKLVFHCQLAHGSPTGFISGFTNVKELYQKIAETYEVSASEILFCTLNTHKIDMTRLLGGQIGLEDFIFAHIKTPSKSQDDGVVTVNKTEDALGLTITDNGAGYAFIKRIKEASIMDRIPAVCVGDHIEQINGKSLVGARHFEVAKMLKEIPKGTQFTMRLVSPLTSGFNMISTSSGTGKKSGVGSGKETLRLRSKGPATVQVSDEVEAIVLEKINVTLEKYMGINDEELATSIWEIGREKSTQTYVDFGDKVAQSDLAVFGFNEDIIMDLWGICDDGKKGRFNPNKAEQLPPGVKEFNENY